MEHTYEPLKWTLNMQLNLSYYSSMLSGIHRRSITANGYYGSQLNVFSEKNANIACPLKNRISNPLYYLLLGPLVPSWALLGRIGPSWTPLGPSLAIFGLFRPSWAHLGPLWPSWAILGPLEYRFSIPL